MRWGGHCAGHSPVERRGPSHPPSRKCSWSKQVMYNFFLLLSSHPVLVSRSAIRTPSLSSERKWKTGSRRRGRADPDRCTCRTRSRREVRCRAIALTIAKNRLLCLRELEVVKDDEASGLEEWVEPLERLVDAHVEVIVLLAATHESCGRPEGDSH